MVYQIVTHLKLIQCNVLTYLSETGEKNSLEGTGMGENLG